MSEDAKMSSKAYLLPALYEEKLPATKPARPMPRLKPVLGVTAALSVLGIVTVYATV